jgi:hypothetical protein
MPLEKVREIVVLRLQILVQRFDSASGLQPIGYRFSGRGDACRARSQAGISVSSGVIGCSRRPAFAMGTNSRSAELDHERVELDGLFTVQNFQKRVAVRK